MDPHDGLTHEVDIDTLRAMYSVLQVQNIKLQRELTDLNEQVTAMKLELTGRSGVVGSGIGAVDVGPSEEDRASGIATTDAALTRGAPTTTAAPSRLSPPFPAISPSSWTPPSSWSWQQQQQQQQQQGPGDYEGPLRFQPPRAAPRHCLSRAQAERYSRHLLLPGFGVAAQERLCGGSVLVVGCGGLGSPVAMYLAAAGVGRLGLVDHDGVDVTNLHRQVMHTTSRVGLNKAVSGRITCTAINPTIQVEAHTRGFTPTNALELVERYDVVVDATDNPATRYLVSDACVVSGKPLVSAAAVGTDGQLTVYNYGNGGPCYRCLFPEAPAPENCSRCGEAGVLGVVPGIMGCLQALEAIKILSGVGDVSSKKLTIFDALAGRFTTVRLRNRNPTCVACGSSPVITRTTLPSYDYVLFTGQPPDDGPPADLELIDPRFRLKPQQVARILAAQMEMDVEATAEQCREAVMAEPEAAIGKAGPGLVERFSACEREEQQQGRARQGDQQSQQEEMHATVNQIVDSDSYRDGRVDREQTLFLDVRPTTQYNIMALPGVMHVPYERLEERLPELLAMLGMGTRVSDSAAASSPTGVAADMEATVIGSPHSGAVAMATITTAAAAASCAAVASAAEPLARGVAIGSGSTGNAAGGEAEAGGSQPRVVVLCRRGNNSQRVVARLAGLGVKGVTDMQGGYMAWAKQVDPDMPLL